MHNISLFAWASILIEIYNVKMLKFQLDKSSVINSLFPPLFDDLRKALVLPTLLLKKDNSLIRRAPILSIVQASTPFFRTTNSFIESLKLP